MKISIITLFPEVFTPILNSSILHKATQKNLVVFELTNLRDFGEGERKTVDGRVYGGGKGMVLRADVLAKALQWTMDNGQINIKSQIILTSASGKPYKQKLAREFSQLDHLIIVCGHYEGVDQRFIDKYVDQEISIGDFVLTGGEIPAMAIVDSVTRLIPGVLEEEATTNESFTENLVEHPQYTRPEQFAGEKVPAVLLSGNHAQIQKWRGAQSLKKTEQVRPDLLK